MIAISLVVGGCTTAISGPLRTMPLESVAPVGEDHASIGASGGGHWNGVEHAGARARIGVARDVDLGGEGSWVSFGVDPTRGDEYGIGHVDVRHRVHESIAFSGGVGLGGGAYGLYGGPDVGVIFAYENPEIVPLLALRIGLSVPLLPTPHFRTSTTSTGTTTTQIDPALTLYMQPTLGFRVPIVLDRSGRRLDVLAGVCFTAVAFLDHGGGMGGAFGGEVGLDLVL